jgi:nitroreductase
MDVIEAINARHSVRDFISRPVSRDTIMKILEIALRAPSAGNSQPWEVFVATGDSIERIRDAWQALEWPGIPERPGTLQPPAEIMNRSGDVVSGIFNAAGLDPSDPKSFRIIRGPRLYGAPVVVVVCMDKTLTDNMGIGLFVQTLCLAAQGYGVDSLISGALMMHQETLRKELDIPENLNPIIGIALGYPNPDNNVNTYRSPRRPIQEVVRFRD